MPPRPLWRGGAGGRVDAGGAIPDLSYRGGPYPTNRGTGQGDVDAPSGASPGQGGIARETLRSLHEQLGEAGVDPRHLLAREPLLQERGGGEAEFGQALHVAALQLGADARQLVGLHREAAGHFDARAVVKQMKRGSRWHEKREQYLKEDGDDSMSDDDICERWKKTGRVASARGTLLHA